MLDVPDEEDDTKDVLDARQEHAHDRSKLRADFIKLFFRRTSKLVRLLPSEPVQSSLIPVACTINILQSSYDHHE